MPPHIAASLHLKMIMRGEEVDMPLFQRKLSYYLSNDCRYPSCIAASSSPLSECIVKYCIIVSSRELHCPLLLPTRGTSSVPHCLVAWRITFFRFPQLSCQYNISVTKLQRIGLEPSCTPVYELYLAIK